ncbi:MAG TPA: hypothetical protein VFH94_19220 [Streptomyces sp.]|nr:hypothetical protein [Streptomyces sp.]
MESGRFEAGIESMADAAARTPEIIDAEIPGQDGWPAMTELTPRTPA